MAVEFVRVEFAEIEPAVQAHLAGLSSAIDSYLEDYILGSVHHQIMIEGKDAGFASIHESALITQFALSSPFRRHGQQVFSALRRREEVRSAFVSTADEFFLSHALDDFRSLAKQAYFFADAGDVRPEDAHSDFALLAAVDRDVAFIRAETGDFFEPIDRYIAAGQLFLTMRGGEPVGFGLMVRSAIYPDVASIGMFTLPRARQRGAGTATIKLLRDECRCRQLRAVAGCWYYNHRSKRTLERAGMYSATRLLKVEY